MQDQYQEKDYNQIFNTLSKELEENPIFNPLQFEHESLISREVGGRESGIFGPQTDDAASMGPIYDYETQEYNVGNIVNPFVKAKALEFNEQKATFEQKKLEAEERWNNFTKVASPEEVYTRENDPYSYKYNIIQDNKGVPIIQYQTRLTDSDDDWTTVDPNNEVAGIDVMNVFGHVPEDVDMAKAKQDIENQKWMQKYAQLNNGEEAEKIQNELIEQGMFKPIKYNTDGSIFIEEDIDTESVQEEIDRNNSIFFNNPFTFLGGILYNPKKKLEMLGPLMGKDLSPESIMAKEKSRIRRRRKNEDFYVQPQTDYLNEEGEMNYEGVSRIQLHYMNQIYKSEGNEPQNVASMTQWGINLPNFYQYLIEEGNVEDLANMGAKIGNQGLGSDEKISELTLVAQMRADAFLSNYMNREIEDHNFKLKRNYLLQNWDTIMSKPIGYGGSKYVPKGVYENASDALENPQIMERVNQLMMKEYGTSDFSGTLFDFEQMNKWRKYAFPELVEEQEDKFEQSVKNYQQEETAASVTRLLWNTAVDAVGSWGADKINNLAGFFAMDYLDPYWRDKKIADELKSDKKWFLQIGKDNYGVYQAPFVSGKKYTHEYKGLDGEVLRTTEFIRDSKGDIYNTDTGRRFYTDNAQELEEINKGLDESKETGFNFSGVGSLASFTHVGGNLLFDVLGMYVTAGTGRALGLASRTRKAFGGMGLSTRTSIKASQMLSTAAYYSFAGYNQGFSETYKAAFNAGINKEQAESLAQEAAVLQGTWWALTSPVVPTQLSFRVVNKVFKFKNAAQGAINTYSKTGSRSAFTESLRKYYSRLSPTGQKTVGMFANVARGGFGEAGQEYLQEIGQKEFINSYLNSQPSGSFLDDNFTRDDAYNTLALSFAAGATMGMFGGGGVNTNNEAMFKNLWLLGKNETKFKGILKKAVADKEITQDEANQLLSDMRAVVNQGEKLELSTMVDSDNWLEGARIKQKIADLKEQKKKLDNPKGEKAGKIDQQIQSLNSDFTVLWRAKLDKGTGVIMSQLGYGFEKFDNQQDIDSAIVTILEENPDAVVDQDNSDEWGVFVTIPDKDGGKERNIVLLNQEANKKSNMFTTGQHEGFHGLLRALQLRYDETVRAWRENGEQGSRPENPIAKLGAALLGELDLGIKEGRIKVNNNEFGIRFAEYVKDANYNNDALLEELMPILSETLTRGGITIEQNIGTRLGDVYRRFLQTWLGYNAVFKSGKDVINLVRDYNKAVESGKGLNRGLKSIGEGNLTIGGDVADVDVDATLDYRQITTDTKGNRTVSRGDQDQDLLGEFDEATPKTSKISEEANLEEQSAEELLAEFELDNKQKDDYTKLEELYKKGVNSRTNPDAIKEAGGGIIETTLKRLYRPGSLATREQFRTELENEFYKVFDAYSPEMDKNNQGIGKQTSNLFNFRANAVATRNIRQQGDTISMSNEKAPQIGDTTQQTDFDAPSRKSTGRKKKYASSVPVIKNQITENIGVDLVGGVDVDGRVTGLAKDIIGNLGKSTDPETVAKNIIKNTKTKEVMVPMRQLVGKWGTREYNDFVDQAINQGLVSTIPSATIKRRLGFKWNIESGLINYKKIGKTKQTKVKDGKKTYSEPDVFEITKLDKEKLKEYYKESEKRQQSLFSMITESILAEGVQTLRNDKGFMDRLRTTLELKKSPLSPDEFMDGLEQKLDQRTKEDTSLDTVKLSKKFDQPISKARQEDLDRMTPAQRGAEEGYSPWELVRQRDGSLKLDRKFVGRKEAIAALKRMGQAPVGWGSFDMDSLLKKNQIYEPQYERRTGKTNKIFEVFPLIEEFGQTTSIKGVKTLIQNILPNEDLNLDLDSYTKNSTDKDLEDAVKKQIDAQNNFNNYIKEYGINSNTFNGSKLSNFGAFSRYGDKDASGRLGDKGWSKQYAVYNTKTGKVRWVDAKIKKWSDTGEETIKITFESAQDISKRLGNDDRFMPKERGYEAVYYGTNDPAWKKAERIAKNNDLKNQRPRNKKTVLKGPINKTWKEDNKSRENNNWMVFEESVTQLQNAYNNGMPMSYVLAMLANSYQATGGFTKTAGLFKYVWNGSLKKFREEHNPPASTIGAYVAYAIVLGKAEQMLELIKEGYYQTQIPIPQDNKINKAKLNDKVVKGSTIENAGKLRILFAGLDPNRLLTLNKKPKTFAEVELKLPLDKKDRSKNNVHMQIELAKRVYYGFEKDGKTPRDLMDIKEARRLLAKAIEVNNKSSKQVNWNAKNFATFLEENTTTEKSLDGMENADKTSKKAKKFDQPTKGISVFDFDDTLAFSNSKVIVELNNTVTSITPAEFAKTAEDLEAQGAEFNFDQFNKVIDGRKGPLADLALKRQDKFGSGDIFVLTARPQASAASIKLFLDGIGLNIPLANITGLENGSPEAKALWVLDKTARGYNDFYFADDSLPNVQAVKNILDQVDVKSKVQQAKASKKVDLDKEFNVIIEQQSGKEWFKTYSDARATVQGKKANKFEFFLPPSAEDFLGLMYKLLPKGENGNNALQWINDNLLDPFSEAETNVITAKMAVANDFKALRNSIKGIPKNLQDEVGYSNFTWSQALRVYIWNMQNEDIPGLSRRDKNALIKVIDDNPGMKVFAEKIAFIQKKKPYPSPQENWVAGSITSDIINSIQKVYRKDALAEWQQNVDIIFQKKNMNKLEALYGSNYVAALKNILGRMKSGSNRAHSGNAQVDNVMDWVNNSVGTTMFFNRKSALLQLISNVNFINWSDNNILEAGKAFANQKQYWTDVMYLLNSDYLVNRRNGLKINVAESEIAEASKKGGFKGVIAYLLNKGFLFTRVADSLAIATGGATFYRNRVNRLLKTVNINTGQLHTQEEADTIAFRDFYKISEETQQSSRTDRISMQQASGLGRIVLNYANTPMQYARIIKRSTQDLLAGRGDWRTNVSRIIYYGAVQNFIFNALQSALFALAFGDDEEEKENRTKEDKAKNIAFGMLSTLLRGTGYGGALVDTLISMGREISMGDDNLPKFSPDFAWNAFDFSPTIDTKVRKLRSIEKIFKYNREEIKRRGFSIENPAYLALGQVIDAAFNLPLDRALRMTMNLVQATDRETAMWQRWALALGWSGWSVGLPYWGTITTVGNEAKEDDQIKNKYKNDSRKLKGMGYKRIPMTKGKPVGELMEDYIEVTRPSGDTEYWLTPKK